ncbi:MAG: DUF6427 family protein [Bacteroidales bacterium]|jgi:hypothetical protein|nr:DUF6427 family protein [Bacteroidales bacterium]MCU0407962.1 DUF6427 family protein [Bacteroidales bacterium]
MVLRQFRGTGPGVIALIVIAFLALWGGTLAVPVQGSDFVYDTHPLPLYALLKSLNDAFPVAAMILVIVMAGLTAILLVNFNTADFFIGERTFLPAFIYVILTGLFARLHYMNPVLPASLFLLLAIIRINGSYRVEGVAYNFFDAGIFTGLGSLIYGNLAWFLVLIFIGAIIFRSAGMKELIISVAGILAPWLLTFGFYYLAGYDIVELLTSISYNLFTDGSTEMFSKSEVIVLLVAGAVAVVSVGHLFRNMGMMKIKSRKTFYLLGYTVLTVGLVFFLVPSASIELAWILFIPVSYFLTYYFIFVKKRILRETAFYILLSAAAVMQLLYLLG